jgi:hypothetical protein
VLGLDEPVGEAPLEHRSRRTRAGPGH